MRYTDAGIPMPAMLELLLSKLESARNSFGTGASAPIRELLNQLSRREFRDAKSLIRFHEALLFLRAFPQSSSLVGPVEKLLNAFHQRVAGLRALGDDLSAFDDFDTSGIAGTTMQDTVNFEVARWLVE